MKKFKDILEDVYTSEYKEKKFVGQDGKTHVRKIRPNRIEFKNSKANGEPVEKNEMKEENQIEEGLGRGREDDEYHTPDPVSRTHKIGFHVSKDGGEKHHRTVTLSNSTKTPDEAKATAKAHLEKQGYKIHEETELAEDIKTEYNSLKKHDIKHLRGLIKTQHKIIDTSEFKTKEHAISHYLRAKHGNKKVADAFGLKEDFETIEEATPYYNKPSFLKKMSRVAKQERQAREKKEAEGKMKTFKNHITHNMPANEEVELTIEEQLHEVLSKDAKAGDWISDFVKSDNPKFEGKSKKERIKMALGAYYGKQNEQAPVAPVPDKKYIKGTPENKAYKATKKPINGMPTCKEEVEPVEEGLKPEHNLRPGWAIKADPELKAKIDAAKAKRKEFKQLVGKSVKEEVELDEKFINGREYASHGLMHPDHAKMDIHKVSGHHVDFYASKTGDKMQGKVTKNDGKSVHIQAHKDKELGDGKLHKFKVTPHLPKQNNEEFQNGELETTMKSYKEFMESLDEALWPGTPEYNKKFGGGANRSKGAETSTTHGKAIGTGTGVKHERDYEKAEKETPAATSTEKRGRGRPAGSTSGARQKGTIAKSEYAGADYTGHKLHLPNSNR